MSSTTTAEHAPVHSFSDAPTSRSDSEPPAADAISRFATRLTALRLSRTAALALALTLVVIASFGDALTTAETTFTLFYVLGLAICTWFAGLRRAYFVALASVVGGAIADMLSVPERASSWFVAWNAVVDFALYVALVQILWALRTRLAAEVSARQDAVGRLRHAERLTTIGKLASGIAHELGTPLNVISGRAELIVSGSLDVQGVKRSAQIVIEQTERVELIIRQLLDFARRAGAHADRADLMELLETTALLLGPIAAKSGVELVCSGPHLQASVNRSEMQQVFTNLITNAIHAMPNGGRIEIETALERTYPHGHSHLHQTKRPFAVVRIRDHGTGIAPDVLPRIFDPFFTTKDVGHGTGLGLSVAYGIVQDHQGWISVDTRLGEGTTVSVYLPQWGAQGRRGTSSR